MTEKHKQEAREIVEVARCGPTRKDCDVAALELPVLRDRIASALSSRDKEIREVLEGLRGKKCWCEDFYGHTPACLAAGGLWKKVQS